MSLYYIKVSKIVSDTFEVNANTEEDAINNNELCMKFFNNTEYVFDVIKDINNKNITSI